MTKHDKPSEDEREAIAETLFGFDPDTIYVTDYEQRMGVPTVPLKHAINVVLAARRDADRRVEEARAKAIEECAIICDDAANGWAEQREFAHRIRALAAQTPPRDNRERGR